MNRAGRVWKEAGGFTLIEIMAALAILGLAMFALLQAHYGALRLFSDARQLALTDELTMLALGIAEVEVATGTTSGEGEFNQRYPDYEYRFEAQAVSEDLPGLMEILVVVTGPEVSREVRMLTFQQEAQ